MKDSTMNKKDFIVTGIITFLYIAFVAFTFYFESQNLVFSFHKVTFMAIGAIFGIILTVLGVIYFVNKYIKSEKDVPPVIFIMATVAISLFIIMNCYTQFKSWLKTDFYEFNSPNGEHTLVITELSNDKSINAENGILLYEKKNSLLLKYVSKETYGIFSLLSEEKYTVTWDGDTATVTFFLVNGSQPTRIIDFSEN